MRLTAKGWLAVEERHFSQRVPLPEGIPLPCPGDHERPCLAYTPEGRRCHFCLRTVDNRARMADLEELEEELNAG